MHDQVNYFYEDEELLQVFEEHGITQENSQNTPREGPVFSDFTIGSADEEPVATAYLFTDIDSTSSVFSQDSNEMATDYE